MAYTIQAVVAKTGVLAQSLLGNLTIVSLKKGMEMIPIGEVVCKCYKIPFCPLTDDEIELPQSLISICQQLSKNGTIAYIEAEIFGGAGTQASVIFNDGKYGQQVVSITAINQALHVLGVTKQESYDEFDTVGLGRHRNTEEWLR
jgi:hypothetical protein